MKDVFCRIIAGEIPSSKIYEDDDVLAILDISQTTRGHALVIAKKHYDSFLSCPQSLVHKVYDVAQRIAQAEVAILGCEGVNVLTNVGTVAGQSIAHFHVHVIPRYSGIEPGFQITMKAQDTSKEDLPLLASDIGKGLKR